MEEEKHNGVPRRNKVSGSSVPNTAITTSEEHTIRTSTPFLPGVSLRLHSTSQVSLIKNEHSYHFRVQSPRGLLQNEGFLVGSGGLQLLAYLVTQIRDSLTFGRS